MHQLATLLAQANPNKAALAAIAAMGLFFAVFIGIIAIISIVAQWRVFEKAGQPGWAALIPVYNWIVFLRIAGLSGWWVLSVLICLIPILGALVFLAGWVYVMHRISVRFGQGAGFTVGLVLLHVIFLLILAFGSAKYQAIPEQSQAA
jgi:hypothetical protein